MASIIGPTYTLPSVWGPTVFYSVSKNDNLYSILEDTTFNPKIEIFNGEIKQLAIIIFKNCLLDDKSLSTSIYGMTIRLVPNIDIVQFGMKNSQGEFNSFKNELLIELENLKKLLPFI